MIRWTSGSPGKPKNYEIGRDEDDRMVINVPTGASFAYTINGEDKFTIDSNGVAIITLADGTVTPRQTAYLVSAHLGSPIPLTDNRVLTSSALLNDHVYTVSGHPDTPRNLIVTVTDDTPSITQGIVRVLGMSGSGDIWTSEDFDISAGAGTYVGEKIFGNITQVDTSLMVGLGGEETIKVGVGNIIGIPTDVRYNAAYKLMYLGGVIPSFAVLHAGINTSGIDVSSSGYDGEKQLIVRYNLGG